MERVLANASGGKPERKQRNGRAHLVVPMVSIVSGVLAGSKGPLYYPPEEVANSASAWDGVPITYGHPHVAGEPVSARRPEVQHLGALFNSRYDSEGLRLLHDGWFDVDTTNSVDAKLLQRLERGENVELSTGLFTRDDPVPGVHNTANGEARAYDYVARDYKPDHLAVLPSQVGACSVRDGCGFNMNERSVVQRFLSWVSNVALTGNAWSEAAREAALAARKRTLEAHEASRRASGATGFLFTPHGIASSAAVRHANLSTHAQAALTHGNAAAEHERTAEQQHSIGQHDTAARHAEAGRLHRQAQAAHQAAGSEATKSAGGPSEVAGTHTQDALRASQAVPAGSGGKHQEHAQDAAVASDRAVESSSKSAHLEAAETHEKAAAAHSDRAAKGAKFRKEAHAKAAQAHRVAASAHRVAAMDAAHNAAAWTLTDNAMSEEDRWEKAKGIARTAGEEGNWAFVMGVFKRVTGNSERCPECGGELDDEGVCEECGYELTDNAEHAVGRCQECGGETRDGVCGSCGWTDPNFANAQARVMNFASDAQRRAFFGLLKQAKGGLAPEKSRAAREASARAEMGGTSEDHAAAAEAHRNAAEHQMRAESSERASQHIAKAEEHERHAGDAAQGERLSRDGINASIDARKDANAKSEAAGKLTELTKKSNMQRRASYHERSVKAHEDAAAAQSAVGEKELAAKHKEIAEHHRDRIKTNAWSEAAREAARDAARASYGAHAKSVIAGGDAHSRMAVQHAVDVERHSAGEYSSGAARLAAKKAVEEHGRAAVSHAMQATTKAAMGDAAGEAAHAAAATAHRLATAKHRSMLARNESITLVDNAWSEAAREAAAAARHASAAANERGISAYSRAAEALAVHALSDHERQQGGDGATLAAHILAAHLHEKQGGQAHLEAAALHKDAAAELRDTGVVPDKAGMLAGVSQRAFEATQKSSTEQKGSSTLDAAGLKRQAVMHAQAAISGGKASQMHALAADAHSTAMRAVSEFSKQSHVDASIAHDAARTAHSEAKKLKFNARNESMTTTVNEWSEAAREAAAAARRASSGARGLSKKVGGRAGKGALAAAVKASNASKAASFSDSTKADHMAAAKAHSEAAAQHAYAATKSSSGRTDAHDKAAAAHDKAAKAHRAAAKLTANEGGSPMGRTEMIATLAANCACWKGEETKLNGMSDTQLAALVAANARKRGSDDDDDEDDDDMEDDDTRNTEDIPDESDDDNEDMYDEMERKERAFGGKSKAENMRRWLASMPDEARGVWNNALAAERREREQAVEALTANVQDAKAKARLETKLLKKPLRELRELMELAGNSYVAHAPMPLYTGAGGGPTANGGDGTSGEPLVPPAINWAEEAD